jgi:hypothetical protein
MLMTPPPPDRPPVGAEPPFDQRLGGQRDEREQSEQRRDRERGDEIVLVVEDLDVQRHGVGQPANVARHHGHGAELAHGARVAQQHAVEQAPFDVGQSDAPEHLPAARAQHHRRLLLEGALLLHQRDQLARDEREGDEHGRQHDAGHGEDDLQIVRLEPRAEPALQAEKQHEDQPRDHRRDRKWQIYQ